MMSTLTRPTSPDHQGPAETLWLPSWPLRDGGWRTSLPVVILLAGVVLLGTSIGQTLMGILAAAALCVTLWRILVPVMKWISPFTGGNSESANNNLTYSWVCYSDDEGQTWDRSLSEVFVALDQGRRGVTHFEETVVEELPDDKVLMFGRTEPGPARTLGGPGNIGRLALWAVIL